ncbi:hypothetical protein A2Y85_04930 [candidate division WOR-3 bacterium RBG_13_43_14]|uniref:FlgD/Vpr Ig-like domain-containing protein n=1 Tax=candidate division WOR-3 bacterium RBG_13_43_14 TaxID=1802590 RepID=A0A1F4UE54_UNCW3|nr:MAG: hypothetical protein A2Y85_04930 [candidate division WOR-3 bacterium RBG_13_43_14]
MDRREFLRLLIAGGAGSLLTRSFGQNLPTVFRSLRYLPPPQINTFSSEIVLNTRRSYHSGYSGTLSDQILANILWAASRAPLIGSNRVIYAARSDNLYRYDEAAHDIVLHLSGNHMSESNCAFEVGVGSDLAEDAGMALHYAHLASIAFWTTTSDQPMGCPKESARTNAQSNWSPAHTIQMVNCHGRMPTVSGITNQLVAVSSNGSLPDPSTDGPVILENGLANLNYGNQFSSTDLSLAEISQLAWASYGNTPHNASGGRAALTAASAVANYYLTGRIYIVRPEGVERYHIRLPGGSTTSRDHRIERVTDGDRRPQLRTAVARIPLSAPLYFVFCTATASRYQLLEAGYCAASALLQATSLNLQGYSTANFNSSERTAIINALGIPSADLPLLVFSAGQPLVGIGENKQDAAMHITATPNPFETSTRISYSLKNMSPVKLVIYDQSGRLVKVLADRTQTHGHYHVVWNGKNKENRSVPKGIYFLTLKAGSIEHREKLIKI